MTPPAHAVQVFDSDDRLVLAVSRYLAEGLCAGCTCIVLVSIEHREGIEAQLRAMALNPDELASEYRYVSVDARLALASFMSENRLDPQRFHQNMGLLIRQAASRGQPVRILDELVALLALDGKTGEAVRLEELWNELSRHHNFTRLCAYPREVFAQDPKLLKRVCALHSHVING